MMMMMVIVMVMMEVVVVMTTTMPMMMVVPAASTSSPPSSSSSPLQAHLVLEVSSRSDDTGEDVLGDVRVDCTEWIVEEVNVAVLVQTPCQTHPLLLTSAQVYALHRV